MWCSQEHTTREKSVSLNTLPRSAFHLNFDNATAVEYGIIRSELERKGVPIGPLDLLIAAHTKSLNYTLVSNNEREFNRIEGLKIEDKVISRR
ncbi:type II toxin-antitoxin system VapC family toxin [Ohtaekwangia sp.]|uniref:type II toxin-antitoxin system VapC family toxin n=1 Tax=Ohtaekwangia sp. TaxID=2066019 RepID=UPI0039C8FD3C